MRKITYVISRQDVTGPVGLGRFVISIVFVGIVSRAQAGVLVCVGYIPVLFPLVQTHQLAGSALSFPSKFLPLVLTKQLGGASLGRLARASLSTFCCSSMKLLSKTSSTTLFVHSTQRQPLSLPYTCPVVRFVIQN